MRAFGANYFNLKIRGKPEIILKGGKPRAVILHIEDYKEMLERLEDAEDLRALQEMRGKPLKLKRLEDFLDEYTPSVLSLLVAKGGRRSQTTISKEFSRDNTRIKALA